LALLLPPPAAAAVAVGAEGAAAAVAAVGTEEEEEVLGPTAAQVSFTAARYTEAALARAGQQGSAAPAA
jgi:hypothetical protein